MTQQEFTEILFSFVLGLTFTLFFSYLLNQIKKPTNFPPGPPWLPYLGSDLQLQNLSKSLGAQHLAFSHLAQKYRTKILGLKLGNEYVITVCDYHLIREVMIREDFEARPDNFFFKIRSFGRRRSGITGSDGIVWSTNRNFVMRHFRNMGFGKKPMELMVKKEVANILEILEKQNSNVTIGKFLAPAVLNILWTLVSGKRISGDDGFLDELLDLISVRGKMFDITGGTLNRYPWLRFLVPKWSGYSLIQELNNKLKKIIMEAIRQNLEKWQEGKDDNLISCYISEMKKADENSVFCEDELMVVCFDLFLAGTKVTSASVEVLLCMMIRYPEIQKKVRDEIDDNIEKNVPLEYSDLKKLPYTNAVLMETQRYLHIFPVSGPRRAMNGTTLGGYFIPKGTTVLFGFHSIHHSREYWHEPEKFKPERFLNENGTTTSPTNFAPFGLGKRRCLGEALAKQCLFFFFVEILRKFNVSSENISEEFSAGITLITDYKAKLTRV